MDKDKNNLGNPISDEAMDAVSGGVVMRQDERLDKFVVRKPNRANAPGSGNQAPPMPQPTPGGRSPEDY